VRGGQRTFARGAWLSFGVALTVRLLVAYWAVGRVSPAMDGTFYDVVARRIALGLGYTWLWPDGVVTYAAHYPVGYPALLGAAYALFGPSLGVAYALNACVGALAAPLAYGLGLLCCVQLDATERRRVALASGLIVAFLPTLVLYTPALMTENLVGTLVLGATYVVAQGRSSVVLKLRSRVALAVLVGGIVGLATLVRPQTALLGPIVGWMLGGNLPRIRRLLLAAVATATLLLTVSPWTLRNCEKMDRCLFVSANGGWNLLIGTFPEGKGGWAPVEGDRVPPACREVYSEALKDECFGRAARAKVAEAPFRWLALVPDKLRVTFDYTGAASEYLSRAGAVSERGHFVVGGLEIVTQRLLFLAALGVAFRVRLGLGMGERARWLWGAVFSGGALGYFGLGATWGHLALLALVGRPRAGAWPVPIVLFGVLVVLTASVHAVFFGAGRYLLPLLPLVAPLAGMLFLKSPEQVLTFCAPARDNSLHGSD
jgi:hypothetical protein